MNSVLLAAFLAKTICDALVSPWYFPKADGGVSRFLFFCNQVVELQEEVERLSSYASWDLEVLLMRNLCQ
jgi:hypothetical protein